VSEDPAAAEREKEMRLFYLRHRDRVRKFVSWRVRDQNDMEDVCQETWRAFFTRFDEYVANYERPTTALFTIVRRRVTDFWRQLGRLWEEPIEGENLSLLADAVSARTRPTDAVDSEIDLERALNALPTRQREALHLHHVDGLTVAETATVMGISPNTLKKLLTGRWRQPQAPEQAGDRRAEAAGRFRGVGPRRLRRGARPVGAGRSGESQAVADRGGSL
jgi:RNA polymerase sigma factor (sigma-70 family)